MKFKPNTNIVYCHENKINGKKYIGITCKKPHVRWGLNGGHYIGCPFYNAILKYGWDNFNHIILFSGLSRKEACEKEKELILKYKTYDRNFGYNATWGGESNVMTDESRKKLSISQKERLKEEKERNRISNSLKKYYYEHPEVRVSISNRRKNYITSEETKKKLSLAGKGRKQTDEWIRKRFEWRKSHPEKIKEYIEKRNKKLYKPIICVDTGIEYESIKQASKLTGVSNGGIIDCCKGRSKKAGGYMWKYKDEKNVNYTIKIRNRKHRTKTVMCVETKIVYNSVKEAGEKNNINPSHISVALKHNNRTSGGYHWVYFDGGNNE